MRGRCVCVCACVRVRVCVLGVGVGAGAGVVCWCVEGGAGVCARTYYIAIAVLVCGSAEVDSSTYMLPKFPCACKQSSWGTPRVARCTPRVHFRRSLLLELQCGRSLVCVIPGLAAATMRAAHVAHRRRPAAAVEQLLSSEGARNRSSKISWGQFW